MVSVIFFVKQKTADDILISDWSSDVCSSDLQKIARFAQPALKRDRALVGRWAQALLAEGIAIITDMPDSDAGLTETVRLLGQVRPTFFGEIGRASRRERVCQYV